MTIFRPYEPEDIRARNLIELERISSLAFGQTFNVKAYGAYGDGETDDTNAIIEASNALSEAGHGALVFPQGEYIVYKQGQTYADYPLAFSGLEGVSIDFRGAHIKVDPAKVWTGENAAFLQLTSCKDVIVFGGQFSSPAIALDGTFTGVEVISLRGDCRGLYVPYLRATNALAGISISTPTTTTGSRNIHIGMLDASGCIYGVNCANSGSNIVIDNLVTDGCGRSFFFYGISHAKANIRSKNPVFASDVAIAAINTNYNNISDIEINYYNKETTTSANQTTCVSLSHSYADSVAGTIENVRINLDVDLNGVLGSAFEYSKVNAAGNQDTTDRGHTLRGLTVSGIVRGEPASGGQIQLGRNGSTFASGENLYDINLAGLQLTDLSGTNIDAKRIMPAMKGTISFRDIEASGDIDVWGGSDIATYTPTSTTANIFIANVVCDNSDAYNSGTSIHSLKRPSASTSPVTVRHIYRGIELGNSGAGGTVEYDLPAATAGLVFNFVQISGQAMRLDPNGTEIFRNQAAGKYLQFDSGNGGTSARIECVTAGSWDVRRSNGTISYEP